MSSSSSMAITEPAASVGGRGALILSRVLAGQLRNRAPLRVVLVEMGLAGSDLEEALSAAEVLESAGEAWLDFRRCGNAAQRGSDVPVLTVPVDVKAAAEIIGEIGERRVRQLARTGELPGAKSSRGWSFDRACVVEFASQRRARTVSR